VAYEKEKQNMGKAAVTYNNTYEKDAVGRRGVGLFRRLVYLTLFTNHAVRASWRL